MKLLIWLIFDYLKTTLKTEPNFETKLCKRNRTETERNQKSCNLIRILLLQLCNYKKCNYKQNTGNLAVSLYKIIGDEFQLQNLSSSKPVWTESFYTTSHETNIVYGFLGSAVSMVRINFHLSLAVSLFPCHSTKPSCSIYTSIYFTICVCVCVALTPRNWKDLSMDHVGTSPVYMCIGMVSLQ